MFHTTCVSGYAMQGGGGVNVRWNFHIPSIHTSSILYMFSRVRRTILCRFEPDQTRMCSDNVWLKTYHLLLSAKIRLVTYGVWEQGKLVKFHGTHFVSLLRNTLFDLLSRALLFSAISARILWAKGWEHVSIRWLKDPQTEHCGFRRPLPRLVMFDLKHQHRLLLLLLLLLHWNVWSARVTLVATTWPSDFLHCWIPMILPS